MTNVADKLNDLSEAYGCDTDVEHMLHEMCHVVLLGKPELLDDLSVLEDAIGGECRWMQDYYSDWHEIKTIACEVCVFDCCPSLKNDACTVRDIAANAVFKVMAHQEVYGHAHRLAKTKVAKRRAKKVMKLIDERWKKLREEQRDQAVIDEVRGRR